MTMAIPILPITPDVDVLFQDKKFVDWANDYLRLMCYEASYWRDYSKVRAIKHAATQIGVTLFDPNWDDLWSYNYHYQGFMTVTDVRLTVFARPLHFLFRRAGANMAKNRKRKRKKYANKRQMSQYRCWADNYLRRFYLEVVKVRNAPESINAGLWYEVQIAARSMNTHETFRNLERFAKIPITNFTIDNKSLNCFVRPLQHIYSKSGASESVAVGQSSMSRFGENDFFGEEDHNFVATVPTTRARVNVSTKSDLETAPAETIDVATFPAVFESKIGTAQFEKNVIKILTHCLKQGWSSVTSQQLASVLGVDQRDFEDWADKCPKLRWRRGRQKPDLIYYCLTPAKFPKPQDGGSPMSEQPDDAGPQTAQNPLVANPGFVGGSNVDDSTSVDKPPENNAEADGGADAGAPGIGSDEFDTLMTQFLSKDKEKPWRSTEAMALATGQDKEPVQEWADGNPALVRRVSKQEEGKVFYALLSRFKEKEEQPKEKEEGDKGKDDKGKKSPEEKKQEKTDAGSSITMQEILAFARLHGLSDRFVRDMDFYANRLATRHEEAFAHLTKAQKHLCSAVALMQKTLKIKDKMLPSTEQL